MISLNQAGNTAEWVFYILDMLKKRAGDEAEANRAQVCIVNITSVCVKHDESCTKHDEFCIKNDGFCADGPLHQRRPRRGGAISDRFSAVFRLI